MAKRSIILTAITCIVLALTATARAETDDAELERLQQQIQQLKTQAANQQLVATTMAQELERLKATTRLLKEDRVKIQEENVELKQEIAALEEGNSELEEQNANLEKTNIELLELTVAFTEEASALREQLAAADGGDEQMSPEDQAVYQRLEEVAGALILVEVGLDDVVQYIAEATNLNIHVRWYALETVGVTKGTPISVDLRDGTWEDALETVLAEAGGEDVLDFDVAGGVITISTSDDLAAVCTPLRVDPSAQADAATYKGLNSVQTMEFDGIALVDTFAYMQEINSFDMDVRWDVLGEAGVYEETVVNLRLLDVSVDKMLRVILEDLGEGVPLCYMVDEGVLTISTTEDIYSSDE